MKPGEYKFTNQLIQESSPYLLQHAHNPVNWYPWGEAALGKAKKENKLLLISIGYAACHWCHVMEQESFEDEEVAKFMNEHFISIKVDREERPDIDAVYMNAVQLLSGSGGWPLNCIALFDGRPIYGGTYFPKDNWLSILKQVLSFAKDNPVKLEKQAQALTEGIQSDEIKLLNKNSSGFYLKDLDTIFSNWEKNIDYKEGGHKGSPKFPMPVGLQFLLYYNYISNNENAKQAIELTLEKMANGGIYDQLGGGFSRYSTDSYWKVPHFEKMLYDNAQLVSLYSLAYQKSKKEIYKQVVFETLEFIKRELSSKEGAFYSSLDADSEGVEGKFYVWSYKEIKSILKDKADLIIDYYNISEYGNWEYTKNILHKTKSDKSFAKQYKLSNDELQEKLLHAKQILLSERSKRQRPALDDKVLTSWNALMMQAYLDAYKVFNVKEYLSEAKKNAEFILTTILEKDYRLHRNFKNGKSSINAFLDDYAFTVQALISLYQISFNEKWLFLARHLLDYSIEHFYSNDKSMFYYTSKIDAKLVVRKMEIYDNVIPSANSQMAKNLFTLGHYFVNSNYIEMAKKMLNNIKHYTVHGSANFGNWDILLAWFASEPYEVAIIGDDFEQIINEFNQYYLPNVFFSGGRIEGKLKLHKSKFINGKTKIYVCRNKNCKFPVSSVKDALKQINNY